jgi:hypothetical protein
MGGREAENRDENVHSEHESVSCECKIEVGNYKHNEAEIDDRNGEHSNTGRIK